MFVKPSTLLTIGNILWFVIKMPH